jgi:hypothetical protein
MTRIITQIQHNFHNGNFMDIWMFWLYITQVLFWFPQYMTYINGTKVPSLQMSNNLSCTVYKHIHFIWNNAESTVGNSIPIHEKHPFLVWR